MSSNRPDPCTTPHRSIRLSWGLSFLHKSRRHLPQRTSMQNCNKTRWTWRSWHTTKKSRRVTNHLFVVNFSKISSCFEVSQLKRPKLCLLRIYRNLEADLHTSVECNYTPWGRAWSNLHQLKFAYALTLKPKSALVDIDQRTSKAGFNEPLRLNLTDISP